MYVASFQPLCQCYEPVGILRIHPSGGGWEHRDEYVWCCTMVRRVDTMELWGVDDLPPLSYLRAIKRYAIDNGLKVAYERHGDWITRGVGTRTIERG